MATYQYVQDKINEAICDSGAVECTVKIKSANNGRAIIDIEFLFEKQCVSAVQDLSIAEGTELIIPLTVELSNA
jgi:hypothetical protein